MSIQIRIVGGDERNEAKVTKLNQLVTAPLSFSKFYTASVIVDDTPVNVVVPMTGRNFIITDIILTGDRSIGANGAVTTLYENSVGPTDSTETAVIITEEIAKQSRMVATGLNIKVTEGRWVNVVADDTIVRANVAGYYVEAV